MRLRKRILFIFAFLLFFFGQNSWAEENVTTLGELLKISAAQNRELAAAREELKAARARVPQASSLPDPTAGYAVMGKMLETPLGPQKDIYEFEQMIPFPGKLVEKHRMAKAELSAAQARLNRTEQEVVLKVTETYYDLYALGAALEITDEVYELLKNIESITQSRYSSQQGQQTEVARAQIEVSETLKKILILREQKETLKAMLKSLLNTCASFELGKLEKPVITKEEIKLEDLLAAAREHRPELLESRAEFNRDTHARALAKYENAPDISVGFQYTRIGEGDTSDPNDGRDAWMIPLKVTLPLWQNRIGGAIGEANSNFKSSEAKLKETENLSEYEVKRAFYRFTSARQVAELYENALVPQAKVAFRSDQAGYEAGRTDILNYLASERMYLNSNVAYYQAIADVAKSFAALERAVGFDFKKDKSPEGGAR